MERRNLGKNIGCPAWTRGLLGVGTVLGIALMLVASSGCPGGGGGGGQRCDADTDCDDGVYCNGAETCGDDGRCADGAEPCTAEQECDEDNDICRDICTADADCDNGDFCDGAETCSADGLCEDGTEPCAADEECNETAERCENTTDVGTTNPGVTFDDLVAGEPVELTAPEPTVGKIALLLQAACTCAWEVDGSGTFEPADECTTTYTPAADDTQIVVIVTCDADVFVYTQEVTVAAAPTECNSNGDCAAGEVCSTNGECVPGEEFAVTLDGCPEAAVDSGTEIDFTAEVVNPVAGQDLWFVWEEATATTNGADTASLTAAETVTVMVTAYSYVDENTNGQWDTGEETQTATAECDITVQFTAALQVDAGGLVAARSATGTYFTGTPGTAGNNALNGSANQQGVDANAIATTWVATSKPTGSGNVTFSNASALATAFTVGAPATAGDYVFTLTATNENTGETESDTVTLQLIATPTAAIAAGENTRYNIPTGFTGLDIPVTVTATAPGTIYIYDQYGVGLPGTAAVGVIPPVLLGSAAFEAGTAVAATISLDFSGIASTFAFQCNLGYDIIDAAGSTATAAAALTRLQDATATPAARQQAKVYVSNPITSPRTARGTGSANNTLPTISLITEVDELALRGGTGGAAVAGTTIAAAAEIHNGLGVAATTVNPGATTEALGHTENGILTADWNQDGLMDMAVITGAAGLTVELIYGHVDTLTDQGDIGNVGGTAGDGGWPAAAAGANISQTMTMTTAGAAGTDALAAIAVGDVNDDGTPDIIYAQLDTAAAADNNGFGVHLLVSTNPGVGFSNRLYKSDGVGGALGGPFTGASVAGGDVNGNGVDDMVLGAYLESATAGNDGVDATAEGMAAVIYGVASTLPTVSLPAATTDINLGGGPPFTGVGTVSESTGARRFGTAAATNDLGGLVAVGDVDNDAALDVLVTDADVDDGVVESILMFRGGGAFTLTTANRSYNKSANADTIETMKVAKISNATLNDLLVGSKNTVATGRIYIVPPSLTGLGISLNNAGVIQVTGAADIAGVGANDMVIGDTVAVADVNQDGTNDLLVGDQSGVAAVLGCYVNHGPVTSGYSDTASWDLRLATDEAVDAIVVSDINGDGIADIMVGDTGDVNVLVGLQPVTP